MTLTISGHVDTPHVRLGKLPWWSWDVSRRFRHSTLSVTLSHVHRSRRHFWVLWARGSRTPGHPILIDIRYIYNVFERSTEAPAFAMVKDIEIFVVGLYTPFTRYWDPWWAFYACIVSLYTAYYIEECIVFEADILNNAARQCVCSMLPELNAQQ